MALNIIKKDTPVTVNTIISLIFGEPGVGKTSFAFTSKNPLLFDTDSGAHRSAFRKDMVAVAQWEDVSNVTAKDMQGYDTLVIDTTGRMLDLITDFIVRTQPKNAQRSGALTMRGYGELKAIFLQWVKRIKLLNKDLIFVAHNKEERDGDEILLRPDIQGGSFQEVFKIADSIGYMFRNNKTTMIEYTPTERHLGKDTANIGLISVPDFNQEPLFADTLTSRIKDTINNRSESGRKLSELVDGYRDKINKLKNPDDFDKMLASLAKIKNDIAVVQIKKLMSTRCGEVNVFFDKSQKKFATDAQPESPDCPIKDYDFFIGLLDRCETKEDVDLATGKHSDTISGLEECEKITSYASQVKEILPSIAPKLTIEV